MRLEPVQKWVVGHVAITKMPGMIIAPQTGKNSTRCYVLETVSPEAAAAGYKPGDIVVAKSVYDQFFKGGTYHRVTFSMDEIIQRVHDAPLNEFTDINGRSLDETVGADGKPLEARIAGAA